MDFKNLATQIVMSRVGGAENSGNAREALDALVAGSGGFDLGEIVGKFQGSGGALADAAKSWLGDGANESISTAQLQDAIGADKIEAFANKLGVDRETAGQKLTEILPELVDRSSRGGDLLSSAGGLRGLAGFASRLFRKSA